MQCSNFSTISFVIIHIISEKYILYEFFIIEYHDAWNMITISEIKNIFMLNVFVCKILGRGNQAFGRKMTAKMLWHLYYGHIRFEYFHMIKHWKSLPSHWTLNLMLNHSNVFHGHRKNSFASLCEIYKNIGLVFSIFIKGIYNDTVNMVAK